MANDTARHQVGLSAEHHRRRLAQIQAWLGQHERSGMLFLDTSNVIWASGFFHIPSERPLGFFVPAQGTPILFVPLLEKEQAEATGVAEVRCYWEFPGEIPAEVWMLGQLPVARLAVDSASYNLMQRLLAIAPELVIEAEVATLRYIKTEEEVALTELAAGYADFALEVAHGAVAAQIKRGITEIEVVRAVLGATLDKMQAELSDLTNAYRGNVSLTVHAGPRGALPHGQPGLTPLRPGDTVIAGVGAQVGGYHAESGCTFVIGDPSADQLRCLEATWACDEAALQALSPGATCSAVNDAALAVLRDAGYGDFIRHRIGHGMGLQGHEAPWLSDGDATVLVPNMVFSNEPGIYRPGIDGYRIIDTMLVTPSGGRRLSNFLRTHGPDRRVIPV